MCQQIIKNYIATVCTIVYQLIDVVQIVTTYQVEDHKFMLYAKFQYKNLG